MIHEKVVQIEALDEAMRETEARIEEKRGITRIYEWASWAWVLVGFFFFIGEALSLFLAVVWMVIAISLTEKAKKKLSKLNEVRTFTFQIKEKE